MGRRRDKDHTGDGLDAHDDRPREQKIGPGNSKYGLKQKRLRSGFYDNLETPAPEKTSTPEKKSNDTSLVEAPVPTTLRSFFEQEPETADQQLLKAAAAGDVKAIRKALSEGAYVSTQDAQKNTPLHLAIMHGMRAAIIALLEHGADVRATNADGLTPLHAAVESGIHSSVKLVLSCGAPIHMKNSRNLNTYEFATSLRKSANRQPELHSVQAKTYHAIENYIYAVRKQLVPLPTQESLLAEDGIHFDPKRYKPLPASSMLSSNLPKKKLIKSELASMGDTGLMAAQGDIERRHTASFQPCTKEEQDAANHHLWEATIAGDIEAIHDALEEGAFIDARGDRGNTALQLAIMHHKRNAFITLLERGADVHIANELGRTVLHTAVEHGLESVVKLLLVCRANPHTKDNGGLGPRQLAHSLKKTAKRGTLEHDVSADVYERIENYFLAIDQKQIMRPTVESLAKEEGIVFDPIKHNSSIGHSTPPVVVDLDGSDRQGVIVKPAAKLPLL